MGGTVGGEAETDPQEGRRRGRGCAQLPTNPAILEGAGNSL